MFLEDPLGPLYCHLTKLGGNKIKNRPAREIFHRICPDHLQSYLINKIDFLYVKNTNGQGGKLRQLTIPCLTLLK